MSQEFPAEVLQLIKELYPWDRCHKSPTADLVKSSEFQHQLRKTVWRWWEVYEDHLDLVYGFTSFSLDADGERIPYIAEAGALRDAEHYLIEQYRCSRLYIEM